MLAVRGRVGGVQPTALVDLGRPRSARHRRDPGRLARARAQGARHAGPRRVPRAREGAGAIAVRDADGAPPPPGHRGRARRGRRGAARARAEPELGSADAMMGGAATASWTATAQMQVVGKRHYGRKALPQGGGGGAPAHARAVRHAAAVEGPGAARRARRGAWSSAAQRLAHRFRIVAVATGGLAALRHRRTSIRATQDLMVLPGIAPLVREGDRFAGRGHAAQRDRAADAGARRRARRPASPTRCRRARPRSRAGEARAVTWDVAVPVGATSLVYEIEAREQARRPRPPPTRSASRSEWCRRCRCGCTRRRWSSGSGRSASPVRAAGRRAARASAGSPSRSGRR